jgi:hypothetical protein
MGRDCVHREIERIGNLLVAHSFRRNISSKLQIHSPAGITIYAIVNKLLDLHEIQKMQ